MKKIYFGFWLLLALGTVAVLFNSCSKDDDPKKDPLTFDKGVVINGVKWATRNVDKPGTFVVNSEDAGMFYQWNRKKAWAATGDLTDWDATVPEGDVWAKTNDPSPVGWRIPTLDEIKTLLDTDKVSNEWTTENGINGGKFTDRATGNILFLPAAGFRYFSDGKLSFVTNSYYWSSTRYDSNYAYYLGFSSSNANWDWSGTLNCGVSIRSVSE